MKKYYVTVNGNRYEVEVEEVIGDFEKTQPILKTEERTVSQEIVRENISQESAPVVNEKTKPMPVEGEKIECPMPGTILSVNIKEGDNIKKGQVMFVLEAMKMENEIMSPKDGKVLSVNVDKGSSVNTGELLAVLQ